MVRVVVDLEALRVRNCGLGQFSLQLGNALLGERGDDLRLTYFLREADRDAIRDDRRELSYIVAQEWRREEYCRTLRPILRRLVREPVCDVWHMSNQFARFWPLDPTAPVLLTIHDLNFLREFNDPRQIDRELGKLQRKLDRAAVVATDSYFVAGEIRSYLNLRGKDLTVVYCGVDSDTSETPLRPDFAPAGRFLFSIGEISVKKNFHVLLDLIARLPEYSLIIAGNKSSEYATKIEETVRQRGLAERVQLPGQISHAARIWLYQNCDALLFPSKTEGFGLPVLEAMSAGKPVFMSHATSLPEVGGPLGFYWHSFEEHHLWDVFQAGMQRVAATPNYSDLAREHARQFTWQRAAQQYAALYRAIGGASVSRRAA